MAKGLELSGFKHAAFVEFNKHACASLRLNFEREKVFEGDIRDYKFTDLNDIDVVAGGPPCQPFSLGGKHKANDDSRDMFPHAIRAIETLAPKTFLFENVKGLLRGTFANYFKYVLLRLTFPEVTPQEGASWIEHLRKLQMIKYSAHLGIKYVVKYALLNAADYGVPQCRERVVIVGVRADLAADWHFPLPTHSHERLLWDKHVTGSYWDRHKVPLSKQGEISTELVGKADRLKERSGFFEPIGEPWLTVRDILANVPDPRNKHDIPDHIFRDGARAYPGHTGSDFDLPAKTIKAGGHGVPGGENMLRHFDGSVRYFTVFEAKLIQTFPNNFVITGAWGEALRQVGNAVPVTLAKKLGEALYLLMTKQQPHSPVKQANIISGA